MSLVEKSWLILYLGLRWMLIKRSVISVQQEQKEECSFQKSFFEVYRKSGTQDPKVGPGTQDPRVGPWGGTLGGKLR